MTAAPEASSYGAAASRWADSLGGGKEEGGGRRPGKGTCKAVWHEELAVFEVLQPRGDSLKSMGSTWRGRTMLHAEEGLWLAERGMLTVHPLPTIPAEQHTAAMAAVAGLTPESTRAADTRNEAEEGSTAAGKRGGRAEARPTAAGPKEATLSPPPRCARAAPCVPQPPQTVASTVAKPLPATRNPYGHNGGGGGGGEGGGGGGDGGGGGGGDGNGDGDGVDAAVTVPVCAGEFPSNPQRQFATAVPTRPPLVADNAGPRCPDTGKVSSAAYESSPTLPGGGPHDMPAEAGLVRGYGVGVGSGEGRRRGAKRGRGGGVGDGERLTLSVGEMFEILARAGVPWECYRAYAELKRRSYVVRRRMEDTIGHDERAPRAAPLPWFGRKRTLPAAGWAPADNAANRENITATPAPAPTTFSFPPFSSSPSSSSSHPSFFPSYKGDVNPIPSSATPSSFLPSAPPPPPPSPHLPPVTFHVYNPTSAFRKRNPGPPDSVLAVCRFEDPMPPHGALVALADHHARLRQVGGGATPDPDPSSQDQDAVGPGTGRQEGRRGGGGSAGGGGGSEAAGEGAAAMGGEGGAAEAGFPMVKLAVVSAEAGVQLFDVCSHDPSTAAGSDPAEVSDKYRGLK